MQDYLGLEEGYHHAKREFRNLVRPQIGSQPDTSPESISCEASPLAMKPTGVRCLGSAL
jgi:hypothetical protein